MKNEIEIKNKLDIVRSVEGDGFSCDENAIYQEYNDQEENQSSLAIRILSVLGGFFATMAFLGFLLLTGIYDSELALLALGIVFIVGSVILNVVFDKLIIDTFSISIYVAGLGLLSFGLMEMGMNENTVVILLMLVAIVTLVITQNYILSFIAVLTITGGALLLVFMNIAIYQIHTYSATIILALTYLMLNESKIITYGKKLAKLYNPFRIGLIISLLAGLIILGKKNMIGWLMDYDGLLISSFPVSSLVLFFVLLYLVYVILGILKITDIKSKVIIYSLSSLLIMVTAYSPATLGAILIVLLCFLVNYKTGFVIGIISLVYFVMQYYYDLNFTLLTKSIILFSSGILFIVLYLFVNKRKSHEKI